MRSDAFIGSWALLSSSPEGFSIEGRRARQRSPVTSKRFRIQDQE
jgi:hypothetical protein